MPYALKSDEENDSIDNVIRQAIVAKDPFLSFSRTGDSPVQWIQLLHALDQQDLPGWPLLTPAKMQMQKCDKCSQEFCSSINYRRHIRVHRRSFNPDKDSIIDRSLLGAFWDKLSYDEAMETVSFKNVTLEGVLGSSIVIALTTSIQKPGFSSMPYLYVKAGYALLDIVQARASRFPISSQDLFRILDNASENTFLRGTAVSMQKYIFEGEAKKIGLEMKNLVACTGFLVEQKLVKAWVADKEAEALRFQKLLVEEEEAAQERKAELLERKRRKKLRQKEQKAKEQANAEKADLEENLSDSIGETADKTPTPPCASNPNSHSPRTPDTIASFVEPIDHWNDQSANVEMQSELTSSHSNPGSCANGDHQAIHESSCQQLVTAQEPREAAQMHAAHRKPRGTLINNNKVWTQKPKPEYDMASPKNSLQLEAAIQPDRNQSCVVLIGSLLVALGKPSSHQTLMKDPAQSRAHQPTVELWKPASPQETPRTSETSQSWDRESETDASTPKANAGSLSSESCLTSCAMDESCNGSEDNSDAPLKESEDLGGLWLSTIRAAEAFLRQRWKGAMAAADHGQLVVSSPDSEPAEDHLASATVKAKSRTKPENGIKARYIPKQRNST